MPIDNFSRTQLFEVKKIAITSSNSAYNSAIIAADASNTAVAAAVTSEAAATVASATIANVSSQIAAAAVYASTTEAAAAETYKASISTQGFSNKLSSAPTALPYEVTAISGGVGTGSGGTDGEYNLVVTGGPAGFMASVVIAAGKVSSYRIINPGISTTNSAPTLSLSGVTGLTGATNPTATVGTIPVNRVFSAPSSDGTLTLAWINSAGTLSQYPITGTQYKEYSYSGINTIVSGIQDLTADFGLSYSPMAISHIPKIKPSGSWNGTLGSGWASGEPTVSSIRALTDSARPELAPFYPYHRWAFNGRKRILFNLEERDPNYPVNMRVHLEGNTIDVPRDTFQRYIGDDGVERTAYLRAFDLDWANFSSDGKCRFYVEAIPSDPTMSNRIIGPFEMKRKTGNLWDATLTFGPGGTYTSFATARAAAVSAPYNTSSYEHIWLKPASSHDYDIVGVAEPSIYNRWGKTLIDGDPGVIWRVYASTWPTGSIPTYGQCSLFAPNLDGLVFGASCQFDMTRMQSIIIQRTSQGAVQATHFAGARIYDPLGSDNMFGAGGVKSTNYGSTSLTNPDAKDRRTVTFIGPANGNAWAGLYMTECTIEGACRSPITNTQLSRNNIIKGGSEDVFSPGGTSPTVGSGWSLCYGNIAYNCTATFLRTPIDSISIIYNGTSTTATVEFFGSNNASGNRIYLRENGTITYTISVSTSLGTGNYAVSDVVAYINANCTDWSATTINDTRRASYFSTKSQTNAKGIAVVNSTWIDNHADAWQLTGTNLQNYVAKNNQLINFGDMQIFFLSIQNSALNCCDSIWINNLVQFSNTPTTLSQWEGRFSNVRVENNYCLQTFYVRTQYGTTFFDDKCTINNNIHSSMSLESGTSLGLCSVKYNQSLASSGSYPSGTNVSDNIINNSILSDPVPTKVKYDINMDVRTYLSHRGVFR